MKSRAIYEAYYQRSIIEHDGTTLRHLMEEMDGRNRSDYEKPIRDKHTGESMDTYIYSI